MTTLHVEITFIKPRWKRLFVCIFSFVCFFYVAMCFPSAVHNIYFIRLWHDIDCLCWSWKCC